MASVLEYATLSHHIYDIKRPLFGLSSKVALIHRHSNIMSHSNKWYLATDVSHTMTPLHDLYAGLYIQFRYGKAKEAVIASQHPSIVNPSAPNLIKQYGLTDNLDLNELGLTHTDEAETLLT